MRVRRLVRASVRTGQVVRSGMGVYWNLLWPAFLFLEGNIPSPERAKLKEKIQQGPWLPTSFPGEEPLGKNIRQNTHFLNEQRQRQEAEVASGYRNASRDGGNKRRVQVLLLATPWAGGEDRNGCRGRASQGGFSLQGGQPCSAHVAASGRRSRRRSDEPLTWSFLTNRQHRQTSPPPISYCFTKWILSI